MKSGAEDGLPSVPVPWLVDGNNVMGSRPDGWWNNRSAAAARLTQEIAVWCRSEAGPPEVTVVFDGRPDPSVTQLGGGTLTVEFAPRAGRNAADDRIVELAAAAAAVAATDDDAPKLIVVTADRGLIARLPSPAATVEGPRAFLRRIGG